MNTTKEEEVVGRFPWHAPISNETHLEGMLDGSFEMQGIVYMPQNLETGSTPPYKSVDTNANMDLTTEPNVTKELSGHQSGRNDSGFLSATNNTSYSEEEAAKGAQQDGGDTDNRSDCSSPDRKYYCPICETMLTSQHEFTLHIRSHNNDAEKQIPEKGFVCRICSKVLSSSSSLDRHVLVHSGERPFTCKYCGDTFTTNGNMHRHMRTHAYRHDYESDASTDSSSSSKNIEFNNNKVDKNENKRQLDLSNNEHKNFRKKYDNDVPENNIQKIKCPVCERDDFSSISTLDYHLEDNHPDYPAKCNQCNQIFKNNKILNLHRNNSHSNEENGKTYKNSVIGFKDLTFVDFSSEKFPHIARYECEKNLHKASTGLKFQCQKCSRAFPCASSLDIHQNNCCVGLDHNVTENSLDLTKKPKLSEKEIRRADFFSRLDLQDNSPEEPFHKKDSSSITTTNKLQQRLLESAVKTIDSGKDLADIQSILSMTANGRLLQHLQGANDSNSSHQSNLVDVHQEKTEEEESQDVFAVEFRKMKLRGEFPCRLCTAIFPNLRALKGHNRTHLSSNNGTYRCNMCPHSSIDKAALIRHMRTHNGDRPYECSLCNYAFTTKANCERHLRNRHAKTTREEVKKSIIYHPSEDPTNDEINTRTSGREDAKKLPSGNVDVIDDKNPPNPISAHNLDTPDSAPKQKDLGPLLPLTLQLQAWKSSFNLDNIPPKPALSMANIIQNENIKEHGKPSNDTSSTLLQKHFNFTPNTVNTSTPQKPKIQVKKLETLKQPIAYEYSDEEDSSHFKNEEEPMDLSTKRPEVEEEQKAKEKAQEEEAPQDLTKKAPVNSPFSISEILTQELMKNAPKIEHSGLYHAPFSFLRHGFPALGNWPPFPAINPLLFQPPILPQDPQEMKRLQRQLCGGGMVNNFTETLPYQPLSNAMHGFKTELKYAGSKYPAPNQIKMEDVKPLTLNIDPTFSDIGKMQSPISHSKPELMQSPNSVKMVIKNGVLMPKQKQRRYRTERPFSCEHCSARFTLRSNMERHIKQQHPQFWSQRQRSNIGNPGRKSHHSVTTVKHSGEVNPPLYDIPKIPDYNNKETKDNHISDKIKYAILAQHLRVNQNFKEGFAVVKKEDDEDCELVIDENDEKIDAGDAQALKNRILEEKLKEFPNLELPSSKIAKNEETQDLVPVSRLLDNASQQQFKEYFRRDGEEQEVEGVSEEDEEGLVASGSTSEGNSGSDENKSESEHLAVQEPAKKKSAYSLAPNRVSCPYCSRKFPWTSSLRRHILTHTGQKPFKCSHCPLLFTTKSNCDRHLLRKHGNSATTISNDSGNSNNSNYLMRNVPERPFKCSSCPSSTFSTYSNLKKHISCKHGAQADDKGQGYEAGSSEDEKQNQPDVKNEWDAQISSSQNKMASMADSQTVQSNSDLPFKCHLCEGTFGERNECLDHIKNKHPSEYSLLMSKNALDNNTSTPEESNNQDEDESEIRGKFPDYSNRKVICAFCMRRFWSAEDLRRHMRTHTGERPFSCDICRRRFTLKHSMLRHRKKHIAFESENLYSDEDNNVQHSQSDKLKFNVASKICDKTDESDGNEGSDLISNLLGIQDRSIIEQVLTSSPDDAAKLLGVKNGGQD